jgi:hypothetical protein
MFERIETPTVTAMEPDAAVRPAGARSERAPPRYRVVAVRWRDDRVGRHAQRDLRDRGDLRLDVLVIYGLVADGGRRRTAA